MTALMASLINHRRLLPPAQRPAPPVSANQAAAVWEWRDFLFAPRLACVGPRDVGRFCSVEVEVFKEELAAAAASGLR